ncbi:rho GTPase-activating protein 2-like, partial [Trifolium medium]|nr:rho GTPase-activating protein 2-like [Trifolium medium]
LVKQLKPTESALLSWAIDLMADVVQEEEYNKMNARNIAMVFAPNMTQNNQSIVVV